MVIIHLVLVSGNEARWSSARWTRNSALRVFPDDGSTHQCVTSMSKMFTRTCSGKQAFHRTGVGKLVLAWAGIEVLRAATGTTAGWLAWQPIGGSGAATRQRSPLGAVLLHLSYLWSTTL
jgi:hypothetical protein